MLQQKPITNAHIHKQCMVKKIPTDKLAIRRRLLVHLSTVSYPQSIIPYVWGHTAYMGGPIFIESMNWESTNQEHTDWRWSRRTWITWRLNSARNTPPVLHFALGGKRSDRNALKDSSALSILCTQLPASLLLAVSYTLHHVTHA